MTFEAWWFLALPVVFGLGWIASRIDTRQLQGEHRALPRAYFKGLNFLLNEQPDQAIDAFIEVARLDPETVELHFALGNLFRRRGETERAIRVHQNLVNRPDLPSRERDHALFELGQDFLRAGLLDRAESTMASMTDGAYATKARRALLEIYEIEKEWLKAIEVAHALQRDGLAELRPEIAQFHCEIAQDAIRSKDYSRASEALVAALDIHPQSVRTRLLQGDLEAAQGNAEAALLAWREVERQNPTFVPLVAPKIVAAMTAGGQNDAALEWLHQHLPAHGGELLDLAYDNTRQSRGPQAALALIQETLQRAPTLSALGKLFDAQAAIAEGARKGELEALRNLVTHRTRHLARYTCRDCGFRARLFYWQCPGCNRWESYSPRRTESLGAPAPSM